MDVPSSILMQGSVAVTSPQPSAAMKTPVTDRVKRPLEFSSAQSTRPGFGIGHSSSRSASSSRYQPYGSRSVGLARRPAQYAGARQTYAQSQPRSRRRPLSAAASTRSPGSPPAQHMKEMVRIHELWQETKDQLKMAEQRADEDGRRYREELRKARRRYDSDVPQLKDQLRRAHGDLLQAQQDADDLRSTNQQLEATAQRQHAQLLEAQERLRQQTAKNTQQAIRIAELEDDVDQLRQDMQTAQEVVLAADIGLLRQQVEDRDSQLAAKQAEISQLQKEVDHVHRVHRNSVTKVQALESRIDQELKTNRELQEKAVVSEEYKRRCKEMHERMNQLQHDCADVAKLFLTYKMDDVRADTSRKPKRKSSKSRKRTPSSKRRVRSPGAGSARAKGASSRDVYFEAYQRLHDLLHHFQAPSSRSGAVDSEVKLSRTGRSDVGNLAKVRPPPLVYKALPDDIQSVLADFDLRFGGLQSHADETHLARMSQFINKLNARWKKLVTRKLKACRSKYTKQIKELKRKIEQNVPYRQVLQRAQIARLSKSLSKCRSASLKKPVPLPDNVDASGVLDLALATVENLSRQLIHFEETNRDLREELLKAKIPRKFQDTVLDQPMDLRQTLTTLRRFVDFAVRRVDDLQAATATAGREFLGDVQLLGRDALDHGSGDIGQTLTKIEIQAQSLYDHTQSQAQVCRTAILHHWDEVKSRLESTAAGGRASSPLAVDSVSASTMNRGHSGASISGPASLRSPRPSPVHVEVKTMPHNTSGAAGGD